jgi:CheY-like chemotaxis protein
MGGVIEANSEEGKGSEFVFQVPARPANPESVVTTGDRFQGRATDYSNCKTKVLLVEDVLLNQYVIEVMLQKLGCEVTTANSGAEAIAAAEKQLFSMVFMDVQMPGMDGIEATAAIRQLPGYREIPIIALTANAFSEDRQRCLDAGMEDVITKPVTSDSLAEVCDRYRQSSNRG